MVVTRSYQILLPKNDFLPFSHWYLHCNPKKVPTWEGKVVEQKQKQFWNQWSNGNNLGACPIGNSEIFSIRITLPPHNPVKYQITAAAALWTWREQSAVTLVNNANRISDINALLFQSIVVPNQTGRLRINPDYDLVLLFQPTIMYF